MIHEIAALGGRVVPYDINFLSRSVEAIGTSDFDGEFFELVRSRVEISHLNVLDRCGPHNPDEVLAASPNFTENARYARERYRTKHWQKDPLGFKRQTEPGLFLLDASEIPDYSYAEECYHDIGVGQRVSIVILMQQSALQLNMFRRREDGPFFEQDLQQFEILSPFLGALLKQHASYANKEWSLEKLESRLRKVAPQLSTRENNVCARSVFGITSECIGLDLGISRNTVLTHRRRAYAKLGICSKSDLFRLLCR